MVTVKKNRRKDEGKKRVVEKRKESKKGESKKRKRIGVVRVRGKVHVRKEIEDTLKMLNLTRVNHCVVIDSRKEYKGMLKKVNDYVTWGEISPEMMGELIQKRGRLKGNKKISDEYMRKNSSFKSLKDFIEKFMNCDSEFKDVKDLKPVFRLSPPKRGYERGGIKKPYSKGGALGYRGEKINLLLDKMI